MRCAYSLSYLILIALGSCVSTSSKVQLPSYSYQNLSDEPLSSKSKARVLTDRIEIHAMCFVKRLENVIDPVQEFKNHVMLSYVLQSDYVNPVVWQTDTIQAYSLAFDTVRDVYYISFSILKPSLPSGVVFLNLHDQVSGESWMESISLGNGKQWYCNSYLLFDKKNLFPIIDDYLTTVDTFCVRSGSATDSQRAWVYFYDVFFPPASAPMSMVKSVSKEMMPDPVYPIQTVTMLRFTTPGLYFIQTDTSSAEGIGFRVQDVQFPKYKFAQDLLQPTIYISTNDEIKAIAEATDPKQALDKHWLAFAGNEPVAKKMIKEYYDRVTSANQYFTSFKEGWKTDRGMIYIVFGKPAKVNRTLDEEEWIYPSSPLGSSIRFRFKRILTLFSFNHFELIRNPTYRDFWYNRVDLWRKGIF